MRLDDLERRITEALELIAAQQAIISDQGAELRRLSQRVESLEAARATASTVVMPRVVEERMVPLRVDPRAEPAERAPKRRPSQQIVAANMGAAQHAERIREHAGAILEALAEGSRQAVLVDREDEER